MKSTWIALLLSVVSFTSIASAAENTTNIETAFMKEQHKKISQLAQNWNSAKDLNALEEICDIIRGLIWNDKLKLLPQEDLSLLFSALNMMDEKVEKIYEIPQLNIAPPLEAGLPSGVDPAAIKDTKLREKYIAAINKNKIILANSNFQVDLGKTRREWMDDMVKYINQSYKDQKLINKLIDDNITKEDSRKELKGKLHLP